MARIVYSALVESIRGSIGGTTFQKNAYGYTVKKKPNMVHPNTPYQQVQKILFARAVTAWNALTIAQRADWDSWASTYPQYSKFNPSSQLSGFSVFVRIHNYRFLAGEAVDTNPTYSVEPTCTLTISCEVEGANLHLVETDTDGNENFWIAIFLSRPFSPSQNFIGTRTRYITTITSAGADDFAAGPEWIAKYGILPVVGQLVAWRAVCWGDGNGIVQAAQSGIVSVIAHV